MVDTKGVLPEEKRRMNPKNRIKLAEIADCLIKSRIAEMLDVPVSSVRIEKDRAGAPYLPGYQGIHISKSYTGRYAVCAVSTDKVGIDIERLHPPNHSIAKRYFNESETGYVFGRAVPEKAAWLAAETDSEICRRWTGIWTLKEAYGKYLGTGLAGVCGGTLSTVTLCALNNLKMLNVPVDDNTVCTVVSKYEDFCIIRIQGKAFYDITAHGWE